MKPKVVCDFETRSEVDLLTAGMMKYFDGEKADIVCFGFKVGTEEVDLWIPGHEIPYCVKNPLDYHWVAHNAQFDYGAWYTLGERYGFGINPISNWVDSMAICGRFTYPQALDKVGRVLKLKLQKNPRGKALIKKICCPPFQYTHAELFEFYDYCRDDVGSLYELLKALPASALSELEQRIWELTVKMNRTGLPIDIDAAKRIYAVTETYKEEQNKLLPSLTNGEITKATQTQRITKFLRKSGLKLPNLQAPTVESLLERLDLTDTQRTILELRRDLGKSSTAKYLRMIQQEHNGRIYNNERYYGSNTGRWAGQGFQMKNLPRSNVKAKEVQAIIDSFFDLSVLEGNPVSQAKDLIRSMVKAPKGKKLAFADYSSIENRLLAWAADDQETLDLFRRGLDQYIDMAAYLFGIAYDDVTKDQRYEGKQLVLGCGFGLGALGYSKRAGCEIHIAERGVGAWRDRYYKVVNYWYACAQCAINAIMNPGVPFTHAVVKCRKHGVKVKVDTKCTFKVLRDRNKTFWLQLTLPSGRALYYNSPTLKQDKFGSVPAAYGIDPYSKQWALMKIIPGRFVENIIQALARDVLADGLLHLDNAGYKILASVHDEVVIEVDEDFDNMSDITRLMCINPDWCLDLPLAAEGVVEKRYRKM